MYISTDKVNCHEPNDARGHWQRSKCSRKCNQFGENILTRTLSRHLKGSQNINCIGKFLRINNLPKLPEIERFNVNKCMNMFVYKNADKMNFDY